MSLNLRQITDAEIPAWYDAVRRGFHAAPVPGLGDWGRPAFELDRALAVFDDDRIVATMRSISSQVTIPGAVAPAALLTGVTVDGTHRRRGLLSQMITRDLADASARGDAFSYLVAAEYPIYGRFGYGPAAESVFVDVDAAATEFLPVVASDEAEVISVEPDDWKSRAAAIYNKVRPHRPGFINRVERWWSVDAGLLLVPGDEPSSPRLVLLRRAGHDVGFLKFTVNNKWEHGRPQATCTVDMLVGETALDEAVLWQFCCKLDWVTTVTGRDRRPGDSLRWFVSDARTVHERDRADFTWLRVLSPAAVALRQFSDSGDLTIAVSDSLGLMPSTIHLHVASDGTRECVQSQSEPDLSMDVSELGMLTMGGVSPVELAAVGRIVEHRPGAVLRAERMFRWPVVPSCLDGF